LASAAELFGVFFPSVNEERRYLIMMWLNISINQLPFGRFALSRVATNEGAVDFRLIRKVAQRNGKALIRGSELDRLVSACAGSRPRISR
jgi:hypothetical protein